MSGKGANGDKRRNGSSRRSRQCGEEKQVRKKLISVLVGIREDLKQEQGAMNKEPSENRKSAWKLKIELLKLKKKNQ